MENILLNASKINHIFKHRFFLIIFFTNEFLTIKLKSV